MVAPQNVALRRLRVEYCCHCKQTVAMSFSSLFLWQQAVGSVCFDADAGPRLWLLASEPRLWSLQRGGIQPQNGAVSVRAWLCNALIVQHKSLSVYLDEITVLGGDLSDVLQLLL